MRSNLRSIFFSLATLVAVAARADGASTPPGQDDAGSHQGNAPAAWAAGADEDGAASDGGAAHAHQGAKMEAAASGSASGEPRKQRRYDTLDDWNKNQFLRETWDSP